MEVRAKPRGAHEAVLHLRTVSPRARARLSSLHVDRPRWRLSYPEAAGSFVRTEVAQALIVPRPLRREEWHDRGTLPSDIPTQYVGAPPVCPIALLRASHR
jgi:hypothetical protein